MGIKVPGKEYVSSEERKERLDRVSLRDKETLKAWLEKSNRRYLIFDAQHLVDSLNMEGIGMLVDMVGAYREYRNTIPTGETKIEKNMNGEPVEVGTFHTDVLSEDEKERVIEWIRGL